MIKSMVTLFTTLKMKRNGQTVPPSPCLSVHLGALSSLPLPFLENPDLSAAIQRLYHNDPVVAAMRGKWAYKSSEVGGKE